MRAILVLTCCLVLASCSSWEDDRFRLSPVASNNVSVKENMMISKRENSKAIIHMPSLYTSYIEPLNINLIVKNTSTEIAFYELESFEVVEGYGNVSKQILYYEDFIKMEEEKKEQAENMAIFGAVLAGLNAGMATQSGYTPEATMLMTQNSQMMIESSTNMANKASEEFGEAVAVNSPEMLRKSNRQLSPQQNARGFFKLNVNHDGKASCDGQMFIVLRIKSLSQATELDTHIFPFKINNTEGC